MNRGTPALTIATRQGGGELWPSLGVGLAGLLWGLFWLPFRAAQQAGVGGGWASLSLFVVCTLVLAPAAALRWRRLRARAGPLLVTGVLAGAAFSLYSTALLLTEVVRAVLLFYLTPVWSTLLGRVLLGEPVTGNRVFALIFGLAGLVVILGVRGAPPVPHNAGDWMALIAGMAWAYGSVLIYRGSREFFETSFMFVLGGLLVTAVVVVLPLRGTGVPPTLADVGHAAPWLLLTAGLFTLPPIFITVWGAARLSPARVGILLMGEVVVGVTTAAIWSGEPFGIREGIGSALIISAAALEVLPRRKAAQRESSDCVRPER